MLMSRVHDNVEKELSKTVGESAATGQRKLIDHAYFLC
jgi:hypothetical protein